MSSKMDKVFAFDMDGVIRIGQDPVEGCENIFPLLKKMGKESLIITNECRYTPEEILESVIIKKNSKRIISSYKKNIKSYKHIYSYIYIQLINK